MSFKRAYIPIINNEFNLGKLCNTLLEIWKENSKFIKTYINNCNHINITNLSDKEKENYIKNLCTYFCSYQPVSKELEDEMASRFSEKYNNDNFINYI